MIELLFHRRTSPDVQGFNDDFLIVIDNSLKVLGRCRTSPNHRTPLAQGGKPWREAYGLLVPGHYEYECLERHPRFGKCLLVAGGGPVPSAVPNPKQGGKMILKEIFIHAADSAAWPGSAGCITLQPSYWQIFIDEFPVGHRGSFELVEFGLNS